MNVCGSNTEHLEELEAASCTRTPTHIAPGDAVYVCSSASQDVPGGRATRVGRKPNGQWDYGGTRGAATDLLVLRRLLVMLNCREALHKCMSIEKDDHRSPSLCVRRSCLCVWSRSVLCLAQHPHRPCFQPGLRK